MISNAPLADSTHEFRFGTPFIESEWSFNEDFDFPHTNLCPILAYRVTCTDTNGDQLVHENNLVTESSSTLCEKFEISSALS